MSVTGYAYLNISHVIFLSAYEVGASIILITQTKKKRARDLKICKNVPKPSAAEMECQDLH